MIDFWITDAATDVVAVIIVAVGCIVAKALW
jgi:hypothetical protein